MLGMALYKTLWKETDTKKLIFASIILGFVSSALNMIFTLRWNIAWGIRDELFVMLSVVVSDTFALAFSLVPPMVLFAKITPAHVEATMFAFLCSILCATRILPGSIIGALINKWFVGVTTEDMSSLWQLIVI